MSTTNRTRVLSTLYVSEFVLEAVCLEDGPLPRWLEQLGIDLRTVNRRTVLLCDDVALTVTAWSLLWPLRIRRDGGRPGAEGRWITHHLGEPAPAFTSEVLAAVPSCVSAAPASEMVKHRTAEALVASCQIDTIPAQEARS